MQYFDLRTANQTLFNYHGEKFKCDVKKQINRYYS